MRIVLLLYLNNATFSELNEAQTRKEKVPIKNSWPYMHFNFRDAFFDRALIDVHGNS